MNDAQTPLDKRRVRQAFGHAAASYDAAAVLQHEIADRLLARLDLIKLVPATIADIGTGTGYCAARLEQRYRRARVVALDLAPAMLVQARARRRWFSRQRFVCGDAERLPLATGSMDMIVSNLALQWCNPDATFREFARVLRPEGLLMFTSFGPDTLRELRTAWRSVDSDAHVHDFIDMHDLGDALVRAGFAEPVMDVERFTLTYGDVKAVLHDLKRIGAHNAAPARPHALTGKNRFLRFVAAYEAMRQQGRIPATYEAVYGHAWAPAARTSVRRDDGTIAVPVEMIRRRR